jgi:hypothetical protein
VTRCPECGSDRIDVTGTGTGSEGVMYRNWLCDECDALMVEFTDLYPGGARVEVEREGRSEAILLRRAARRMTGADT